MLAPPPGELAPPPRGNPGSATAPIPTPESTAHKDPDLPPSNQSITVADPGFPRRGRQTRGSGGTPNNH